MAETTTEDYTRAEKEHHTSAGRYWLIWVGLLVLTITTVVTGRMDLGHFNLPLAMLIATIKATLVVLFFMHLAEQKGANRIVFVVSVFFVLLMLGFILGDVATRFPLANPPTGQNLHAPGYHHQTDADVQGPKPQPGSPSKDHPY